MATDIESFELVATPGNELPNGMTAGSLVTPDGVRLRYALCRGAGTPLGTVCIFQGRGEFIERYFETVRDLRSRGFAVALLDWRGQGGSERRFRNRLRGYVASFRQYDQDLASFMTGVVLPDCPPPYYALGHSTGGNVVLRALARRTWFNRAILSSPLLGLPNLPLALWIVRLLAASIARCGFGWMSVPGRSRLAMRQEDFPGNPVTSDERRYMRDCATLEAAPWLAVGRPTFGWLSAALAAIGVASRMPARGAPLVPVLIVAAGEDRIVSTEAARAFGRRVPGASTVVIEGARHELLMERDVFREQFWAAFDAFIGGEEPLAVHEAASRALA